MLAKVSLSQEILILFEEIKSPFSFIKSLEERVTLLTGEEFVHITILELSSSPIQATSFQVFKFNFFISS